MRKALLLYNPLSGRRRGRRVSDVEAAAAVLRAARVEVCITATRGPGDASEQVKHAIADGFDTVFACGGDGTVHDALQGLVGTDVALAIIPLGTANSLAHDLGAPISPAGAARAFLHGQARRVAVGRVEYLDLDGKPGSRYFALIVGIGADAHLFYKLNPVAKRYLGMMAYCLKATRLWLTHKMEHFQVELGENGRAENVDVSQLLAVRIRDFGGVLRELAPGASLERDDLRLVLFETRNRISYLRYITRGLLGARWQVPGIELRHSNGASCRTRLSANGSSSRILVEADGELIGTLPAKIDVVPEALTLLMPQ
jgi:diacylglycerol kinase (ATP)